MSGGHKSRHRGPLLSLSWNTALKLQSKLSIGHGAVNRLYDLLKQNEAGQKVLILHQPSLSQSRLNEIIEPLKESFQLSVLELPDGDDCKSADCLLKVWSRLQAECFSRSDTLVCIGGGALCDLGGFAASTYVRGTKLVLVPTTLLAQVDAAIGGKTAINLSSGKNLAGTFYFPDAVLVDLDFLSTLPERQFKSGLAEIIKYALIENSIAAETEYKSGPRSLWEVLQQSIPEGLTYDNPVLPGIITTCIRLKLSVVAADPYEGGIRRCLNLGHTLGHALEKISNYEITHGQAVAVGTMFALNLSAKINLLPKKELPPVEKLLQQAGLPTSIPAQLHDRTALLSAMAHDKKRQGTSVKFVLPKQQLGQVDYQTDIALADLSKWL